MANPNADIGQLAGFVNEPYQKQRVLEAVRSLQQPFILREAVAVTGLPNWVVSRILARCVKQRVLIRRRLIISFDHFTGKGSAQPRWTPGGRQRRVWGYSFAEGQ